MEEACRFSADGLMLEALYENRSETRAVVITHPHPLYGGTMHNPVVDSIRKAYHAKGYSTLRFNFRGVGKSMGEHDQGLGEINDIFAARDFLINQGYTRIDLTGYSFGAWVNLMATRSAHGFDGLVLVSPPVDFIEFEMISNISTLNLVISGGRDEYASCEHIKKQLKNWNKSAIFIEIPGADHFYTGELGLLQKTLEERL
ncbi:MAG: prolyl oligopeptidase family serine peptidase [Proteobacteria bacterium]|nr:prolyl oligopeptidase family serine peptidase [Pseudomonadota bacterium]